MRLRRDAPRSDARKSESTLTRKCGYPEMRVGREGEGTQSVRALSENHASRPGAAFKTVFLRWGTLFRQLVS